MQVFPVERLTIIVLTDGLIPIPPLLSVRKVLSIFSQISSLNQYKLDFTCCLRSAKLKGKKNYNL